MSPREIRFWPHQPHPHWIVLSLCLFGLANLGSGLPELAQEQNSTLERWFRVDMFGTPSGWMRESERLPDEGDLPQERTTEMLVRVSRLGTELVLWSRTHFRDGATPVLLHESSSSPGDTTRLRVQFSADSLIYQQTSEGRTLRRSAIRPDDLILPNQTERLFADPANRDAGPVRFRSFHPDLIDTPRMVATFLDEDSLFIRGKITAALRWQVKAVEMSGIEAIEWRSPSGRLLAVEHPHLMISYTETDRHEALASDGSAEIMIESMIPIDHTFDPAETYELVQYRVIFDDGERAPFRAATATIENIENLPGETRVTVRRLSPKAQDPDRTGKGSETWPDALRATLLIQADDPAIVDAAQTAIRESTDRWEQVVRLERYVNREIRNKDLQVAFGSAAQTLKRRQGDCTEHAILLAAMARSIGIPARLAAGLVGMGDTMGYHLWTEVCVQGRWIGIDAALGRTPVDGRYLPLAVSDLAEDSPAPLVYGLLDVMMRVRIEVLDVGY